MVERNGAFLNETMTPKEYEFAGVLNTVHYEELNAAVWTNEIVQASMTAAADVLAKSTPASWRRVINHLVMFFVLFCVVAVFVCG